MERSIKAFVLVLAAFVGGIACAAPEVEYIKGSHLTVSIPVQGASAKQHEVQNVAVKLLQLLLSKSSFADLQIDSYVSHENNFDGSVGYASYVFSLSDKDGNKFTGYAPMKLSVRDIENPRNGKHTFQLIAREDIIMEGEAHVILRNYKKDSILRSE